MPSTQPSAASPAVANKSKSRKPSTKLSHIVKFTAPSDFLRKLASPQIEPIDAKASSSPPEIALPAASSPLAEIKAESTPLPTAAPTAMLPPTEAIKKKAAPRGTKRGSGAMGDLLPKPRGKPGPKKKPRLEDGTIDHTSTPTTTGRTTTGHTHKLGPKANQGAINAGLRALDRSGKPCRKWQRGSFQLKSFTGVIWEIPRWRAPPKLTSMPEMESTTATSGSGEGSGKENKEASSVLESEKSNSAGDVDIGSLVSSPAPAVAA